MRNQNCILGGSSHESKVGYIPVISGISRVNPPITGVYIYILYNPLPIRGRSQQVKVIIQLVHWSCHPPVYTGPPGAAMLHVCFTIIYLRLGPCWGYNKSVANINRSLRDDRTLFSLSIIMFSKGNHPQMAQHFRFMNHLPIYIYIYVVWATATYTIYDLWISR